MSLFSLREVLRPKLLRPLPASLRGIACARCDKPQSSWWADLQNEDEDKTYVCSICMIYDTKWGREHREDVEEVVMTIQKARDCLFDKNDSNQLLNARDADDVLGVVVLADRTVQVQRMTKSWEK